MSKWLTHIVPAFAAVIPSVGAVLVAANTLSVAWTGTTGSPDDPDTETMVLTLLDYDASSCSTNCELSPCTGAGAHLNESTPFGNDGGEIHACVGGSGCYPHQCDPTYTLAPDDLRTLIQMIPSIPANTLASIGRAEANLLLNQDRRAVQIMGCEGLVLASVELTPDQQRELGIE